MSTVSELLQAAVTHHQAGEYGEAKDLYQQTLLLEPQNPDALHLMGVLLHQIGNNVAAEKSIRTALAIQPQEALFYTSLGLVYQAQGKHKQAISYYRKALELNPHLPEAHLNLGNILSDMGNVDEALQEYQSALQNKPDYVEAYYSIGNCLKAQGKLDESIVSFQEAIRIKPSFIEAYNNLGNVFEQLQQWDKAILCYQQIIHINPNFVMAYNNLGNVFKTLERYEDAIQQYQQAILHEADYAVAHYNLGNALKALGRFEEALTHYNRAIQLNSSLSEAHMNRSLILLLQGNYAEGWSGFEYRFEVPEGAAYRHLSKPLWQGEAIQGKRILVLAEQGFGDVFQFLRFLPRLHELTETVILACRSPLLNVLRDCEGLDELVEESVLDSEELYFDTYVYLMSLPKIFQTTLKTLPAVGNPLRLDDSRLAWWKSMLALDNHFKIGITWATHSGHPTQKMRSCDVRYFQALTEIPNTTFYSLQIQPEPLSVSGEIPTHWVDLSEHLHDFADTAAAISQLDLVITIDTAVAHLAGILGKQVWILLPFLPDWRWMLHEEDSPWYPTATLIRQPALGDWKAVFKRVKEILMEKCSSQY